MRGSFFTTFLKKTTYQFDLILIQKDVRRILENPEYKHIDNQVCLTGTSPHDTPFVGTGSLLVDFDRDNQPVKIENPLEEEQFIYFLNIFKDTYLFKIYQELSKKYLLGRFRIMNLAPKSCYSFHYDKYPRIHIAVFSDPDFCGLIYNNRVFQVQCDGFAYRVDTTKRHTAFNTSFNLMRTHLVIDILDSKG